MKIELIKSPVVFKEEDHRYMLDNKRLLGITGLIREILGLGTYPEANQYVKTYAIPRAGHYGTSVHHAIQMHEDLGLDVERVPNPYDGGDWEVGSDLANYKKNRDSNGFENIECEYTVSDNEKWASNIDNVWVRKETNGIWLADTKTNNLEYYPGGVDKLKEYLSWQLSIYAVLFERQNPTLKVEGLCANWLRHGESEFFIIERKSDADVDWLLQAEYYFDPFGEATYTHPDKEKLSTMIAPLPKREMIVAQDVIDMIYLYQQQADESKRKLDELKKLLRNAMEEHSIKSWDSGRFKATIAKDSEKETFDTKRFKEEHPDLYKLYTVKKTSKGGFTIKLRES